MLDFVFFDSGGTLFDLSTQKEPTPEQVAKGQTRRVQALLNGMGVDVDSKCISAALKRQKALCSKKHGDSYQYLFLMEAVLTDLNLPLCKEDAACLADAFAGPRYSSWLFPGTREALKALHDQGFGMGIIANTNWPGFSMDRALAGIGILKFFDVRIYSGDVGIRKPDPGIFRLAEMKCGFSGKSVLFVGDDLEADIKGADLAGWSTAFRSNGTNSAEGFANMEFAHISELVEYCEGCGL